MSLRVNVGCGSTPTPGWVNFDNSITVRLARWEWTWSLLQVIGLFGKHQLEFARVAVEQGVRWADAARSIPLESASVEVLYSSHMLEHLDREGARRFLQEARRVLRPGGTVRIAVPDLRLLVERYVADGDADRFIGDSLLAVPARRRAIERIAFALLGKRHHLWMYDGASLKKLLEANGFANAAVLPAGVTTISNPEPLNLSERAEESVFVETVRVL